LDGTLTDSDRAHYDAFDIFLKKYKPNFQLTQEYFNTKIHGGSNDKLFPALLERELSDEECKRYADEKEQCFRDLTMERGVTAIEGGKDFILWAKSNGFRVGIVTNAPRPNAEVILQALNIVDDIECLVLGEECEAGKPSPIPYIEGSKKLGVPLHDCIIFEDSPAGTHFLSTAH
jgi:beta-phosphoglucomutase-like phosphatase (HAD superfamily)